MNDYFSFAQPLTLAALAAALRSQEPQRLPAETEARLRAPYPPEPAPAAGARPASWLLALACGTGPEVSPELVRRLLLLKAHQLSQVPAGAPAAVAKRLLDFYNREVWPVVYEQGTAETPLAHLALPLLGLGDVNYQGYRLAAADVLELFGWAPLALPAQAGPPLLSGAEFALAYATEALERATHLLRASLVIAALSAGAPAPDTSHELTQVAQVVEAVCNAGGAASLPLALGQLARTVAEMGQASAQRTGSLLATGAPAGLLALPGVAASLAAAGQRLSGLAPAPPEVRRVVENTEQLLGLELLAAAQMPERPAPGSPTLAAMVAAFGEAVNFAAPDRLLAPDLHRAARFVREYNWI
ncbi:hypothetical protein A0257_20080 [Hymenobacter psoromatis]|nr:hypothetical protein A0257_20080 [Hymenobacter psoromatis]